MSMENTHTHTLYEFLGIKTDPPIKNIWMCTSDNWKSCKLWSNLLSLLGKENSDE